MFDKRFPIVEAEIKIVVHKRLRQVLGHTLCSARSLQTNWIENTAAPLSEDRPIGLMVMSLSILSTIPSSAMFACSVL
jgi:hypothetical protein